MACNFATCVLTLTKVAFVYLHLLVCVNNVCTSVNEYAPLCVCGRQAELSNSHFLVFYSGVPVTQAGLEYTEQCRVVLNF